MYNFNLESVQAGGIELARDVRIQCCPGQVTLLSGPNGAGKSTLLNQLANQYPGTLVFRPAFGLRDELTVEQQVNLFIKIFATVQLNTEQVLMQIGLSEWRSDLVRTLSSGQRSRLGMVVLICKSSTLWLLDEPLNGLDHNSLSVLSGILTVHLSQGGCVLLVSHLGVAHLKKMLPSVWFSEYIWRQAQIKALSAPVDTVASTSDSTQQFFYAVSASQPFASNSKSSSWLALLQREFILMNASKTTFMWSGLFLLMILSFFGLALLKPTQQTSLAVIWVGVLLAVLLSAKDWFSEDYQTGWFRLLFAARPELIATSWLVKIVATLISLLFVIVPIVFLASILLNLSLPLIGAILIAIISGLLLAVPLLGLVSLMVFMTRGGAVLVYILALPLLVPTLIFGLEASQAQTLGRSPMAVLMLLWALSVAAFMLGTWVSNKLMMLILD